MTSLAVRLIDRASVVIYMREAELMGEGVVGDRVVGNAGGYLAGGICMKSK